MSSVIITSIIAFTGVILLLVFILLFAQSRLVQSGPVKIIVNGDEANPITAPAGSSLLSTLSGQKVFLPSACGGGGTCAQCKCTVQEGGGEVLPTEVGHLSRSEQKEGVRLGCQVKVKQDMRIEIPEEIFGIKKWEATVVRNYNVASFIKEFVVEIPEDMDYQAGGYIQIEIPECEVDYKDMDITAHPEEHDQPDKFQLEWDKFGLWDLKMKNNEVVERAYSMASYPAEGREIML
ncbi:MAG: 2Fe-2S iron-sulfur cluster-binding protein, partial [Marinoscillum sp.]